MTCTGLRPRRHPGSEPTPDLTTELTSGLTSGRPPGLTPGRESGGAVVEFVVLTVLVLLPVIYLILAVARVQAGTYAVTAAAREAARAAVTAPVGADLQGRSEMAAALSFEDHGFEPGGITLRCAADPCLTPDARIDAQARLEVALPGVPAFLASAWPATIAVEATHGMNVARFRER